MHRVSTATMRMLSRYLEPPTWGNQPTIEFWLIMPMLPEPLGDSQTIQK